MTLQQIQGKDYVSEKSDEISDESLNEFWQVEGEELEKERNNLKRKEGTVALPSEKEKGKIEIDQKLDQFLSIHSMNLTSNVREYLDKAREGKLSSEETISKLGLVAFERKKFLKSVAVVET